MAEDQGKKTRIVVGVDGSEQSKLALRWAAHLADANGAGIDAVMAWEIPPNFGSPYVCDPYMPQVDAQKVLSEAVAEVFGADRPARLREVVEQGNAARMLLAAAEGAAMLVVGSRGHGGFAGLLLGSVSTQCAAHATCPVLVVHGNEPPT